jgi:hypothetical protein
MWGLSLFNKFIRLLRQLSEAFRWAFFGDLSHGLQWTSMFVCAPSSETPSNFDRVGRQFLMLFYVPIATLHDACIQTFGNHAQVRLLVLYFFFPFFFSSFALTRDISGTEYNCRAFTAVCAAH